MNPMPFPAPPDEQVKALRAELSDKTLDNLSIYLALACNHRQFVGILTNASTLSASTFKTGAAVALVMSRDAWLEMLRLMQANGGVVEEGTHE